MNNTINPTDSNQPLPFLTLGEKRIWLANIFRDKSGQYTDADKLKVLEADNILAEAYERKQIRRHNNSCYRHQDWTPSER